MRKQYWVSYGRTESGDDLPVLIFENKPSDEFVEYEYKLIMPWEFEDGLEVHYSVVEAVWPINEEGGDGNHG